MVGDLVQQSITQNDTSITAAVLAVGTIALSIVIQSSVAYRWPRTRLALDGRPLVVVAHGRTVDANLRSQRMSVDDVHEAARMQGIHDLADIEYAVLEADGRISFLTVDGPPRPPDRGIAG